VGGTAALAVEDTDDQGLVRLLHELPGAKVEFAILTDFEQQKKAAKEALAAAKVLARTEPGPAHRRLLQVAQEYPFEASVVTESLQLAATLESTAKKDVDGLRESVQAFTILGSTAALDDMLKRAKALREAFLAGGEPPPEGAIETDVPGLVKRAEALAGGHAVERALPDLDRFENVGRMLEETPGFEAMAALVYRSITQNYASLAKADPEVAARLEALAVRRQALEQRPDVRDSLPPSTPR
jgi:hypothetical protein